MQTKYKILIGAGVGAAAGGLAYFLFNGNRRGASRELSDDLTWEDFMDEESPASTEFDKYNSDSEHYVSRDN